MPRLSNRMGLAGALAFAVWLASSWPRTSLAQTSASSAALPGNPTTITNLAQLSRAFGSQESLYSSVRLEVVVCASSRPDVGVVVTHDATGVELLELGRRREELPP